MIPCKPLVNKLALSVLFLIVFSSINSVSAQDGRAIFNSRCASCHILGKDATGPNLQGVIERWGGNMDHIKTWVKNYSTAVSAGYPRAVEVVKNPTEMTKFEGVLTDVEIETVIKYVDAWQPEKPKEGDTVGDSGKKDNSNAVMFGVISLILGIIALILMQVNSNLKKMSDDAEGIHRPDPVPFYKNKVYIATFALLCFAVMGYFFSKAAIGFGRQKGYQPIQPIYYSHKVHAGINQISCLYCHGSAWDSKHAAIPAVNICMNCHKAISSYEKGPKLYDESGKEINGTYEIEKLYKYAGFDPKNPTQWDPSKAKPIEWVKIHNLPDHVYFNHSQHIRAGNVQCQTCHGEITAMDEVKQVAELSMGWCVNCHRETKVNFNYSDSTGNQFYSIYERFHNNLKTSELDKVNRDQSLSADVKKLKIDSIMKTRRMDSVTVKDIGGLECQKCHY